MIMENNRTTEIVNRFTISWRETQIRYDKLINSDTNWNKLIPVQQFISTIIQNSEDCYFRAGTSMSNLIISRSVDFGLRLDQKYIIIEVIAIDDFEVTFRDGETVYRTYRITKLTDSRLINLLKTLKRTLVD